MQLAHTIHRRSDSAGAPLTGWPHPGQRAVLRRLLQHRGPPTLEYSLCCGRGYGKTTLSVDLAVALLNRGGDEIVLVLAPDWRTMRRSFLRQWKNLIPSSLYKINKQEAEITWLPTGAILWYAPRAISGSDEDIRDRFRGANLTAVIDDESARGFDSEQVINTLACVRSPSAAGTALYVGLTTPRVGAWATHVSQPGHVLETGSSYDNPVLSRELVDSWVARMSPLQADREIYGRIVATHGRIWDTVDLVTAWPEGNLDVDYPAYQQDRPYYLFCDLGSATSAFVAVQPVESPWLGPDDQRWVIVAEFCPALVGDARRAFRILRDELGQNPAGVVAGADVHTHGAGDGRTPAYFAEQIFGAVPVLPVSEHTWDRQIQYDTLSSLWCSARGVRRLTVARDLLVLDRESRRGVREMIAEDTWLEYEQRRPYDVLPKNNDIRVQHIRDALLMGAVRVMRPPKWLLDPEELDE